MQIDKSQVKWTKELVGKKVYLCTTDHPGEWGLPESHCDNSRPWLCEAEVVSIVGKRVLVKPVNFCIFRAGDSEHEVTSQEVWFTSPCAAVLARLKALIECEAKLVGEGRLKRDYDFTQYTWLMSEYTEQLELAEMKERFKSRPCDLFYKGLLTIFGRTWWNRKGVEDSAPNVVFTVDEEDFRRSVNSVKEAYHESIAKCFQKTDDGKYKVTTMSVYQFLKSKGRLGVPIIREKWLSSVLTEKTIRWRKYE